MNVHGRHFFPGVAFTAMFAVLALALVRLPTLEHLGPLAISLLLGLGWRALCQVPPAMCAGVGFSAKTLLRWGIVLLGVRLDLNLVLHTGPIILLLDGSVIIAGLLGISWLGRRFGLDPTLACLIAVDSSICGASAAAAAAPTLRAREQDLALVIPLCSLLGTTAMLTFTLVQHACEITPEHYGLMAGATLHEVAQVIAAVAPVPSAVEIGTVTKLTRVVLLVPVLLVLGWVFNRRKITSGNVVAAPVPPIQKPWFVFGFLIVAGMNTLAQHLLSPVEVQILQVDRVVIEIATFLMAMAMGAMGLRMDLSQLRGNGFSAVGTALLGWLAISLLAAGEIALMVK